MSIFSRDSTSSVLFSTLRYQYYRESVSTKVYFHEETPNKIWWLFLRHNSHPCLHWRCNQWGASRGTQGRRGGLVSETMGRCWAAANEWGMHATTNAGGPLSFSIQLLFLLDSNFFFSVLLIGFLVITITSD